MIDLDVDPNKFEIDGFCATKNHERPGMELKLTCNINGLNKYFRVDHNLFHTLMIFEEVYYENGEKKVPGYFEVEKEDFDEIVERYLEREEIE